METAGGFETSVNISRQCVTFKKIINLNYCLWRNLKSRTRERFLKKEVTTLIRNAGTNPQNYRVFKR